jgi:hypothetical protein
VSTWTGSGAPGSTPRTTWTWRSDVRAYRLKRGDPDVDYPLDRERERARQPRARQHRAQPRRGYRAARDALRGAPGPVQQQGSLHRHQQGPQRGRGAYDLLEPWEQRVFEQAIEDDEIFYFLDFENLGGIPTPLMLHVHYEDGSDRELELPAEIWRRDAEHVTHRLIEKQADRLHRASIAAPDRGCGLPQQPLPADDPPVALSRSTRQRRRNVT